jgi:putative transposase
VFTDAMLTVTEQTMRGVRADLDVELVEFNGQTDHAHLQVAYPPTLAISVRKQRLKVRTACAVDREYTGISVRACPRAYPWSALHFAASCGGGAPPSIIKYYINGHARPL